MNKNITITTLLVLLIGTGSYTLFTNIDFTKDNYYCENRIELGPMNCERFSASGIRCYPNKENNTGYKDCSLGWTKIEKGIEIPPATIEPSNTLQYICYVDGQCIEK